MPVLLCNEVNKTYNTEYIINKTYNHNQIIMYICLIHLFHLHENAHI